jgi:hypothetical protein
MRACSPYLLERKGKDRDWFQRKPKEEDVSPHKGDNNGVLSEERGKNDVSKGLEEEK